MAVARFWRNVVKAERFARKHGLTPQDVDYDNMGAYVRYEPRKPGERRGGRR